MAVQGPTGITALDRLRDRLTETESRCPECGSDAAEWRCETDGGRVRYQRTCQSCNAVASRTLRLRE
ncbi:HVO_0649 family zinc finger protein [Haloglomus halophilum]|uniref:HVO_0649 family zinc finger protein n=1 Tax=Haloglomus halophilum TaxID=2962672 RepID=UPI0020CA04ED|nr:HVO_0649 family zinc finger protein [Haloglomus halophilum]